MSCGFRRPHIHELFGLDNTGGLGDALQSSDLEVPVLDGCIKQTPIRDVRLVPSGAHPRNSAALLSSDRMRTALDEARRQADIILIDTAPLLASAEVTHLFPLVDAVVVVARAKRTTAEIAERASELLKRLEDTDVGDGIRRGLLETLDERAELCRRMRTMNETDRRILFLWYVKQLSAQDISKEVGISRRQCFRRRARAIRILLGEEVRERTVAPRSVAPREALQLLFARRT